MAKGAVESSPLRAGWRPRTSGSWKALAFACLVVPALFRVSSADAQAQQQYVYGSSATGQGGQAVGVLAKNGGTGALSAINQSPFAERVGGGQIAMDAKGRFLFVLSPSTSQITMFQIDSSTGALSEVPTSPFAAGFTINPMTAPSSPQSIATEASGQFLYVGYQFGSGGGNSGELDQFTIDAEHLQLIPGGGTPLQNGFLETISGPLAMASAPNGRTLYVYLGFWTDQSISASELDAYSIDPITGNLTLLNSADYGELARSLALDPKDRFIYTGQGLGQGQFEGTLLSPVDGSLATPTPTYLFSQGANPDSMAVEATGQYLYVYVSPAGLIHIFSIDPSSGAPTEVQNSPQPISVGSLIADPLGPFLYGGVGNGVFGYQIDLTTGLLTELPGSPYAGATGQNLAISGIPVQAVSGPVAALFPETASFGNVVEKMPSATLVVEIVSNGSTALDVNAIGFSGAAASDFSETNTCNLSAVLQPGKSCSVSVTFTPSAPGLRQAMLTVTDNAPGSPQTTLLTGMGLVPASGATFMPGSLSFPTITEGTISAVQSIILTSSGNVPLNISSIAVGGANANDFSASPSGCSQLSVNSACTINVTFTPLAVGGRAAIILVNDDAPGSPQMIAISGDANSAVNVAAAQNGSTMASVSAGNTAQYNLQIMPGANYSGTISLNCTGAPLGAVCQASPPMVMVSNGAAVPFMVLVSTSGGASAMLAIPKAPNDPPRQRMWLGLFVFLLLLTLSRRSIRNAPVSFERRLKAAAMSLAVLLPLIASSGCGGGSAATTPPPIITPKGTTMLTITPMATNAAGQPLQLQPIQLTLTVK